MRFILINASWDMSLDKTTWFDHIKGKNFYGNVAFDLVRYWYPVTIIIYPKYEPNPITSYRNMDLNGQTSLILIISTTITLRHFVLSEKIIKILRNHGYGYGYLSYLSYISYVTSGQLLQGYSFCKVVFINTMSRAIISRWISVFLQNYQNVNTALLHV